MPAPARPPQLQSHGVAAWLQFLWTLLPIPGLNFVAWIIGAIVTWSSGRSRGPIAAANGRHALNWCLTYVLIVFGLLAIALSTLAIASAGGTVRDGDPATIPVIAWAIVFVLMNILLLVNGIVGAMRANRGEVFRGYLTIPFLRTPKTDSQSPYRGADMR